MSKITPTLWYDGTAEEAANFYVTLLPDSRIEAVSFMIETEDQAETDRLWDAIASNGGQPGPCGWIKNRSGVSWQITPKRLLELVTDRDSGRAGRAMQSMVQTSKIDIAALERAPAGRARV
jgi:predicted 3-demethylubiquinone-9 3-methyltransferase (glyoxalase superfamily)